MKKLGTIVLLVLLPFLKFEESFASQNWLKQMIALKEQGPSAAAMNSGNLASNHFFATHYLVLFYASTCPHCHQFAPVLKAYATRNKARVLAFSLDNKPLHEFPNYQVPSKDWIKIAFAGRAIGYPALFIGNTKTKALYPVSFGSLNTSELEARMANLIEKIKTYEKDKTKRQSS